MREFNKEEMGYVAPKSPIIMLSDKFVDEHLHLCGFLFRRYDVPVELDVQCPFCKDGIMVITEMKKDICEVHVCHTGNSYSLQCSDKCNKVKFIYFERWLYC